MEKTCFEAEVVVPPGHAGPLLQVIVLLGVLVGAVLGPVLTLRGVPVDFPVWATVSVILGQCGLLGLVVLRASRARGHRER
ncbi:hypothetical protein J2S66_003306 [Saccharothrix longispora]|uniref:Uncharacterized protein n=1 Tax=Saccharothrix longispora TaxID=33920 RepID=A0ABU1PW98_9PSEU|nr:hypothetical protein [Saccharothrix longispora]